MAATFVFTADLHKIGALATEEPVKEFMTSGGFGYHDPVLAAKL